MRVTPILAILILLGTGSAHVIEAGVSVPDKKLRIAGNAVVTAGNGIYSVHVANSAENNCGAWTARTGPLHPAGAGLNVLHGGGFPGTSNTILRSYTSDTYYATGNRVAGGSLTLLCSLGSPETTPLLNGPSVVGYRLVWTFDDGVDPRTTLQFEQEVLVVGPADGSETTENTVIRETHKVRNIGPARMSFGLRKQWDWQIGGDDGPYFGSCTTPSAACDASMNLTGDASLSGAFPRTYVINQDPAITACPSSVQTTGANCGGSPPYLVAGTVAPPSALSPPPTTPELLQFNSWSSLIGSEWLPALETAAFCGNQGPSDDTAVAYFYGLGPATAIDLAPGEERSFTQYVVAFRDACPDIVARPAAPVDPCCPPWSSAALESMLFYQGSGGIADPYTLTFQPSASFRTQIQAYIDYVRALNPAVMSIHLHFRLNDEGTGAVPSGGPQVGGDHFVGWSAGGGGSPNPPVDFFDLVHEPMQVNRWYRVHTGIFLDSGHQFFPPTCADNDVYVRIQVQKSAVTSEETAILQFRRGDGRIVERSLDRPRL